MKNTPQKAPPSPEPRTVRLPETERITGLCDMTLRRLEEAGKFPRRFKLNPDGGPYGAVAHDYGEVLSWLESRRASREVAA